MATQLTFRRGTSEPTQASGLTLGEPAFNTALNTFHIGRGAGVTAAWVGARISGLSADIAAGLTLQVPTMSAVKDYVASTTSGVATLNSLTGAVTLAAGTNIGVTTAGSSITVTNLGVQSFNGRTGAVQGVSAAAAGDGIAVSGATGAVTITNTGVTRAVAGTGISVSGATGSVTITNIGVQSFNGNTGAVTGASLGANTFTGLNTFNAGITTSSIYASLESSFGARLNVGGVLACAGDFDAAGAAFFGGVVTFESTGGVTFESTTDHAGVARFAAGITTSTLNITGLAKLNGNVDIGNHPGDVLTVSSGTTFTGTTNYASAAKFNAGLTASTLDVSGAARFANGLTSAGSIKFSGSAAKEIFSNTAPLSIVGVTGSGPENSIILPVDNSALLLGSATGNVNIVNNQVYAAVPGLRILTDDYDVIGPFGTIIKPIGYATAERTQTLQNASGTIALTSQLMGAVNGSTAATNAVTSFNGLTGAVGGVTTSVANTFTAAQTFNSGLTASTLDVSGTARTTGNMTVGATLTVTGNLIVNGTTTTINSTTLSVDDKNIVLADGNALDSAADGGGITLKGLTDKTFTWVDGTDSWTSSEHMDLAATKVFKIGTSTVLSSNALGSGVTGSSLTAVGTLATGVWQATAIGATYGGTGLTSYTIGDVIYASGTSSLAKLTTTTAGYLLSANGAGAAPEYKQLLVRDAAANSIATITSGSGTLTATIQNATSSAKGVASFDNTNFTVSTGAVTITGVDGGTY